ncbi:GGDEF domain-containing protein [Methylobacillus arboreus]|uniref:GGDEF domain-containing protein n=1 Tax=Methylobacillus arboreus TaxID=755170 RepID=UPI001E2CAC6A|nr:GGDEF domain-containing protein [Methylobacillus arboreus]MCB5190839.1 GGDEF domain-containing protein [Methylobacillus arboreus]
MMQESASAIEIARQTLMQLASRKIPPTPDNFRAVYDEIAGVKSADSSTGLANALDEVLLVAGLQSPKYLVAAQAIKQSVESSNWQRFKEQLTGLLPQSGVSEEVSWPTALRHLLKQLEASHRGVTLSRKREGLQRLLGNFEHDPALPQKIHALADSWGTGSGDDLALSADPGESIAAVSPVEKTETGHEPARAYYARIADHWREMLMRTISLIVIPQLAAWPEMAKKAEALLEDIRLAYAEEDVLKQAEGLKSVLFTLEMHGDTQQRTHDALLQLLRLLMTSMNELVMEDRWLHGQTMIVQDILSRPLSLDMLYDAESSLKELIFKQGQLKPRLLDARDSMKKMAEMFVVRLADLTDSASDYQDKIDGYKQKITETEDIVELHALIDRMLEDTRSISFNIRQSREILLETQQKVVESERLIQELTSKLDYVNEVAHEDFLTGTLNRRGMEEALEREFDRANRHGTRLSLAMMDIDHFKRLNDQLGHATGDKALVHLSKVIRESLRSTDVLARYGGEEFIIILPGTGEAEAVDIMKRAQRDLTRNFFMLNNERVLITFSAGVAEREQDESAATLLPRADKALYRAKQGGRNLVIGTTGL